jgi:FkbM family methyltransferase
MTKSTKPSKPRKRPTIVKVNLIEEDNAHAAFDTAQSFVPETVTEDSNPVTPKVSREDVQYAFRYIFGTEAREEDIQFHIQHQSVKALREFFFSSKNFIDSLDRRILYPAPWVAVNSNNGFLIWVCMKDLFVSTGAMDGVWEPAETQFCKNILTKGSVFLDAGAMIGWFTLLAASVVGASGKVYSFEPHQETVGYLRSSISINRFEDRISLFPFALSDKETIVHLFREVGLADGRLNAGNTWMKENDLVSENEFDVGTAPAVKLDSMKFDRRIDLFKIDVEGAEGKVFNGGENTIHAHRPTILCEMFPEQLQKVSGCSGQELIQRLENWGYKTYFLLPDGSIRSWQDSDMPLGHNKLTTVVFQ